MTKQECIGVFNATIRGTPVSFQEKLLPMVSDYLTEIKCEKSDKIISLIVSNPTIIQQTIPTLVDYYCRKYNIYSVKQPNGYNLKTILYYE